MDDKLLQRMVQDALAWEPSVDASHIGVTARDGVVTLSGSVESYAQKVAAERAAKRVRGVHAIAQEIESRLPSDKKHSDDEIAKRALDILRWDTTVPDERISVKVEHGVVTLTGEVPWQYQRARAESLVHRLGGVLGVIDDIRVKPAVAPRDVHRKIENALRRSAELDAARVTVDVDGGKVILGGMVRSRAERQAAEHAAWAAPGVTQVEDRIAVTL